MNQMKEEDTFQSRGQSLPCKPHKGPVVLITPITALLNVPQCPA